MFISTSCKPRQSVLSHKSASQGACSPPGDDGQNGGPQPCALPGVHEAAKRLIMPLPRGKLLDLAAGGGALSDWARREGFDVTAVDVSRDYFRPEDIPFVEVDLNRPFPWADESVDIVVALEIVEHLEDPFGFLREISRVLGPGGHVILSTPNEHNLQNRLAYFLTGFYGDSRSVIRADDAELPMRHINMIPPAQLELAWRMAGLELVGLETSRWRRGAKWLWPMVYPLQRLIYWLRLRRLRDPADRETALRTYRLLNRPAMLLGRIVAYHLRKPA